MRSGGSSAVGCRSISRNGTRDVGPAGRAGIDLPAADDGADGDGGGLLLDGHARISLRRTGGRRREGGAMRRSRPYAGATRIRFKGSPRGVCRGGISAPCRGSPRRSVECGRAPATVNRRAGAPASARAGGRRTGAHANAALPARHARPCWQQPVARRLQAELPGDHADRPPEAGDFGLARACGAEVGERTPTRPSGSPAHAPAPAGDVVERQRPLVLVDLPARDLAAQDARENVLLVIRPQAHSPASQSSS